MSRIVLITHTCDDFRRRKFLLGTVARHWIEAGHEVSAAAGLGDGPAGDIAVMHLDLSVVPEAYSQASAAAPLRWEADARAMVQVQARALPADRRRWRTGRRRPTRPDAPACWPAS
ncbi:hypothetical protein [Tahibacter harae]|uniref:Glycosyl transferase family 4 n=1 Tax=Tahibacter harae TaxID=2963937 RepID=A0ABT1QW71_9GAMM|nr:hypothetical protein [Tahibacter harae]MCQ4166536.1 hypothetical protein [Tahibacter harae]